MVDRRRGTPRIFGRQLIIITHLCRSRNRDILWVPAKKAHQVIEKNLIGSRHSHLDIFNTRGTFIKGNNYLPGLEIIRQLTYDRVFHGICILALKIWISCRVISTMLCPFWPFIFRVYKFVFMTLLVIDRQEQPNGAKLQGLSWRTSCIIFPPHIGKSVYLRIIGRHVYP